jgi:hypothetical protein
MIRPFLLFLLLVGCSLAVFPDHEFQYKVLDPVLITASVNGGRMDPLFLEMCTENGMTPQTLGFHLLSGQMEAIYGRDRILTHENDKPILLREYDDKRLYVRGILSVANTSRFRKASIITDYYLRLTFYLEVLNLASGETYFGTSETGLSTAKISDDLPPTERDAILKRLYRGLYENTIRDLVLDMSRRYSPGESDMEVVTRIGRTIILSKGSRHGIASGEIYIPDNRTAFPGVFKIAGTQPEFCHAEWLGEKAPPAKTRVTRSGGNIRGSAMLKILPFGGDRAETGGPSQSTRMPAEQILGFFYSRLSQSKSLYVLPPLTSLDHVQEQEANQGDIAEMTLKGQREWPDILVELKILYITVLDTSLGEDTRYTYKIGAMVRAVDFKTLCLVYTDFKEDQIEEVFKPGLVEFSHEEMIEVAVKNAVLTLADAFGSAFHPNQVRAQIKNWDADSGGRAVLDVGQVRTGQVLDVYNPGAWIEFDGRREPFYQHAGRIRSTQVTPNEFEFMALHQVSRFKKGALLSGLESRTSGGHLFRWGGLTADSRLEPKQSGAALEQLIIHALAATGRFSFDLSDDPMLRKLTDQIRYQGKFALAQNEVTDTGSVTGVIEAKIIEFPGTEASVSEALKLIRRDADMTIVKEKGARLTRTFSAELSKKEQKKVKSGKMVPEELNDGQILYHRSLLIRKLAEQLAAEIL